MHWQSKSKKEKTKERFVICERYVIYCPLLDSLARSPAGLLPVCCLMSVIYRHFLNYVEYMLPNTFIIVINEYGGLRKKLPCQILK
jgi:hypothetical protein